MPLAGPENCQAQAIKYLCGMPADKYTENDGNGKANPPASLVDWNRCGLNWEDSKGGSSCPIGVDRECATGQKCYANPPPSVDPNADKPFDDDGGDGDVAPTGDDDDNSGTGKPSNSNNGNGNNGNGGSNGLGGGSGRGFNLWIPFMVIGILAAIFGVVELIVRNGKKGSVVGKTDADVAVAGAAEAPVTQTATAGEHNTEPAEI